MSDGKRRPGDKNTGELLGDLESIRSLLAENETPKPAADDRAPGDAAQRDADEDVPLLEDVVHGGVSVNETFLAGEGDFAETGGESALNEDIFKALLSDEWRESARELLDEARAVIERHQDEWTPQHTDELNRAIEARIDETLQQWLRDVVRSRIDELRRELLTAVSAEIRTTVAQQFSQSPKHEGPDGE